MNDLERFQLISRGQDVDYVPLLGLPGASGAAFGGAWGHVTKKLYETGMPSWVKGWNCEDQWTGKAAQSWSQFWGTITPLYIDFWPGQPPQGIKSSSKTQGNFEIIEYETGAVTRQLLNNSEAYSMPEFIRYHVRDRQSWELYKNLNTPGKPWPAEKIELAAESYKNRSVPLMVSVLSTWGFLRDISGTEFASTVLYDDPELAGDIIDFQSFLRKKYLFPLIRHLKPEIIKIGEDICYNHGMLIGPDHFEKFCTHAYKEIRQLADQCRTDIFVIDTDGNIAELLPIVEKVGVNGIYPVESKANSDIVSLKKQHPGIVFFGGIEKEIVNEGNNHLIESEIKTKVVSLLEQGRYFPNLDHSLQPMCTFENLCEFISKLYKATGNPCGKFREYTTNK